MHSQQIALRSPARAGARSVRRIQPSRGLFRLDLSELWRFRELLYFLVWRDVKARYKQTFLGVTWAVLRPFLSMVVFTLIFNRLAGIAPGNDVPYPLFVFAGLLVWMYFGSALNGASGSILNNANLVTKTYFPRVYVAVSGAAAPLVDFLLSFVVLAGLFAWYERAPSWQVVLLPLFLGLAIGTALGVGFVLAAVTVRYRDIPFALPFVIQFWMYLTPVLYPVTLVPERFRWLLGLNPLAASVDGVRWALFGGDFPSASTLASSTGVALALLAIGLVYFHRAERRFADVI